MRFINLQLCNGDFALVRVDQVVGITGRDMQEEPERDTARDSICWSSRRGSFAVPATVSIPMPDPQPATCKVHMVTGETFKAQGTPRALQAQLLLATRPAWCMLLDWFRFKAARA